MDYTEAIKLALAGEQRGFRFLYENTFQKKYFLALHYMKNKAAAEDVLQEAYIRAFSKLDTLKKPEKFPGWFGMIVANTARNALKKKNPILFSDIAADEYQDEFEYQIEDDNVDHLPEKAYTRKETRQLAYKLLDSLSEEQRMCILMFHIEGMTIRQIASALGCSENTVKSRLKYGRENIKEKGEELQRQGYQLYSTASLPLLLYLLQKEAAHMKADGYLKDARTRMEERVVPPCGEQKGTDASRGVQRAAGRSVKAVKSGFLHTATGKITVVAAVLCLFGGAVAYGGFLQSRRNTNENEAEPKMAEVEREIKLADDTQNITVKDVQDTDYEMLIAGNLNKEELQFVLAYGPQEIPEQGFQSSDYLDILNSFCDASGKNAGGPMIEDYGPDANWRSQYSVSDVNRLFRSFTDYQLKEGDGILAEYNVQVQGNAVVFAGASISKTSNAAITSAKYTGEEMDIYYTYDYITADMARDGVPQKKEVKKAVLKPNVDGLYQIVAIEVIEEQASKAQMSEEQPQTEQMPEEKVPEEPAENVGFPAGNYSFVTQTGGARSSLTIDSAGVATYVEFNSGTGQGYETKYQMTVDNTVAAQNEMTVFLLQFLEGNTFQLTDSGREVTGYLESGDKSSLHYDANQRTIQDTSGIVWVPAE